MMNGRAFYVWPAPSCLLLDLTERRHEANKMRAKADYWSILENFGNMIKKKDSSARRKERFPAVQLLSKLFMLSVPCLLENKSDLQNLLQKDLYSMFTFDQLHSFHLPHARS